MTLRVLVIVLALLDPIVQLDHAVRDAVQAGRVPALESTMRSATGVGRPTIALGALLAIAIFGGPTGVPMARAALAVLVPVNLTVEGLKWSVGRTRPDGDRNRKNSSFPSSHAANAAVFAWLFARRWPRGTIVFACVAAVIAFSRMYLDRHYLSDVVAGILIGLGLALAVMRAWPALDPCRLAAPSSRHAAG